MREIKATAKSLSGWKKPSQSQVIEESLNGWEQYGLRGDELRTGAEIWQESQALGPSSEEE